ncbi:general stress protein [Tetragenococcus muriaticus PMC-11-5]|uniref:General stress protein n=1 Tax=Tetragenococcus muriaticus PMC-11-5 TaxID=1302649 RepID=A0A091BXF2_9ENTE|nr:general stress protein [Tetragenococcus muriaticus PMC-11-5]
MTYKIGDVLEGTVTGVQNYGVFVSLDNHTQGLIHISEIQSGFTKEIQDIVQIGEQVQVQIIDIDEYTQKTKSFQTYVGKTICTASLS